MFQFLDELISEIKKRPLLWDKKFKNEHYGNRRKVTEEWQNVASILNKTPDELKAKWRNLKDTFHREEKKIQLSLVDEGKPLISYYTGQWDKFEKLLFLYNTRSHTRSNEEYIETSTSEICIENIKVEFDASDSNDNDPLVEDEDEQDILTLKKNSGSPEVAIDRTNTPPTIVSDLNNVHETRRKRALDDSSDGIASKKRTTELTIDVDVDEDMLIKSLVPFLKKLNPIRKLIVRNELQNLLLNELLCDECRTSGQRPDCRCNFNQ